MVNDLQVAFDGDAEEIDLRAVDRAPEQILTQYQHTEPVVVAG